MVGHGWTDSVMGSGQNGHAWRWAARGGAVGVLALALSAPALSVMAATVAPAAAGDQSTLLFVREAAGVSSVMSVAIAPSTGLPSAAAVALESSSTLGYSGLTVSPNGAQVAFVASVNATGATSIQVRAVVGASAPATVASVASTFPGPVAAGCAGDPPSCPVGEPAWSPDGGTLLFTRYGADTGTDYRAGDLFTVPAAGGAVTALPGGGMASHGSYIADGSSVIAADEDSDAPVRLLRIASTGARSVLTGGDGAYSPSVSPDGLWVAAIRFKDEQTDSIVVLPAAGGAAAVVSDAVVDPNALVLDAAPTWTADSVRVYFDRLLVDGTGSRTTVRSVARDGSAAVGLTPAAGADEGWPAFAGGDRTAPVARMVSPTSSVTLTPAITLSWAARDPGLSGVASYDVRYRYISSAGAYSSIVTWRTGITETSASFPWVSGRQYCWWVRATDNEANIGEWSTERCSASPLDDRQLIRSRGWEATTNSAFYRGAVISTRVAGVSGATSTVKYRQVGVVTRTCPTCGVFTLYLGRTKLTTVNTKSSTTRNAHIVWLRYQPSPSTGALKVVVNGGGRVYLDGIALLRQ